MVEPIVVNAPALFPGMCIQCHGQTGPLVDTSVENRFGDRVYLCASCVRLDGIALGLIKGKQHSTLLADAQRVAELEKQVAAGNEHRAALEAELKAEHRAADALAAEAAIAKQRIEQLESALRARAEADLATVMAGLSDAP